VWQIKKQILGQVLCVQQGLFLVARWEEVGDLAGNGAEIRMTTISTAESGLMQLTFGVHQKYQADPKPLSWKQVV